MTVPRIVHPVSPVLRVRYRHGVLVAPDGSPDWTLCARAVVELPPPDPDLTLDEVRVVSVLAANLAIVGDPLWTDAMATPAGWCWAPLDRGRRAALVPIELHGAIAAPRAPAGGGLRTDAHPVPVGSTVGDAVPDDVLDVLERVLGWALPARYRQFLARTNGSGPAAPGVLPGFGFVADQPLFGIARADRHQDLSYVERVTADLLPIGYVQGGLLTLRPPGDDVWYWDGEPHRCADSIDDLWDTLARPADALVRRAGEWSVVELRDDTFGAGLPLRLKAPWQPRVELPPDPLAALFEAR